MIFKQDRKLRIKVSVPPLAACTWNSPLEHLGNIWEDFNYLHFTNSSFYELFQTYQSSFIYFFRNALNWNFFHSSSTTALNSLLFPFLSLKCYLSYFFLILLYIFMSWFIIFTCTKKHFSWVHSVIKNEISLIYREKWEKWRSNYRK